MLRPQPVRLTREQLGSFLKTPELIRAFEAYIKALAELTPDELLRIEEVAIEAGQTADSAAFIAASAIAMATSNAELLTTVETLETRINQLQAQLVAVARQVNDLYQVPL